MPVGGSTGRSYLAIHRIGIQWISGSQWRMCGMLAGWLQASCYLDCDGLVSVFDFPPAFEGHSDETTDLDYVLYSGWDR